MNPGQCKVYVELVARKNRKLVCEGEGDKLVNHYNTENVNGVHKMGFEELRRGKNEEYRRRETKQRKMEENQAKRCRYNERNI